MSTATVRGGTIMVNSSVKFYFGYYYFFTGKK